MIEDFPIVVFGSIGSGSSIMIWTVKKILWPNLTTNNPLCSRNSAHNQPLCEHWFGGKPFQEVVSKAKELGKIIHAEPLEITLPVCRDHRTIFIQTLDDESVREAAMLIRSKMPQHYGHESLADLARTIYQGNRCFLADEYRDLSNVLYLDFKDLAHGDLDSLLDKIYTWLGQSPGRQHDTIVKIHQRWRLGNQRIWETS